MIVASRLIWIATYMLLPPTAMAQLPPLPQPEGSSTKNEPHLFVAKRIVDLGKILDGDKVAVAWTLENRGSADLVIKKTKSSCGCAVLEIAEKDKIIRPGRSLKLKVVFDSTRRRGFQKKYVTIMTNDPSEPNLKLEFQANVEYLYELIPPNVLNLQMLHRGQTADKTLDITPAPNRSPIEILELQLEKKTPLTFKRETFQVKQGTAHRVVFTVMKDAALGRVKSTMKVRLRVDGIEKEHEISVRCAIAGDLAIQPKLVDATRQTSKRGKQLAPVTIRSTSDRPFDVISASAGSLLDVQYKPMKRGKPRTHYRFLLTISDDAPAGPFGTALEVRTTCLDQPVVLIPVFGIVAPRIDVEPPIILLRQDGTPAGEQRRLTLKVPVQESLEISGITCENAAVSVTIDREASASYHYLLYLDVNLVGKLPAGTHETSLVLATNVKGAERLDIPVRIVVPE